MKKFYLFLLAMVFSLTTLCAQTALHTNHENLGHLLPQPRSVLLTGNAFTFSGAVQVTGDADFVRETAITRFLTAAGQTVSATAAERIVVNKVTDIEGTKDHDVPFFENEAYRMTIDGGAITVDAVTRTGVVRAMQTLQQLLGDYPTALPGCEIVDWPAFKVRGFMHDIGRSYISVAELKKEIDLLSLSKVNVFFCHLSDKHGFRFQSLTHPEVNTNFTPSRSDKFYTQSECREIQEYAYERGVTILPEIDMPGHSARFEGATGHTMASVEGRAILKDVLRELVATFHRAPYIHIGGDETTEATPAYVNEMADFVHGLGKKVALWNRYGGNPGRLVDASIHCDLLTNWATAGTLVSGLPNIDMRYNYINHFDMFADLAGLYRSNIFGVAEGTPSVAGTITGLWNDRLISDERLIIRENNLYANALASADRAWKGGGKQYIEQGGAYLPNSGEEYEEFKDWETRFLFQKAHSLRGVAADIPYVKQTNIRWNVTKAYPNNGAGATKFAPETTAELTPQPGSITATGAGVWLNHIWGGTIAGVLGKAAQSRNQTRYAWTYVYSPDERQVGLQFQTFDYSRSQRGTAPAKGKWDKMGSQLWLNDAEIAPTWDWTTGPTPAGLDAEESELGNLNFTARTPIPVTLRQGWNKVLIKLPYVATDLPYSQKWQWTCVFTDLQGLNAVEDLIYSPTKVTDDSFEDEIPLPPFAIETDKVYQLKCKRGGRYVYTSGVGTYLTGVTSVPDAENSYWFFKQRADGKYDIVSYKDGSYIKGDGVASGAPMRTTADAPATGWEMKNAAVEGYFVLVGEQNQFNQQSHTNYYLLNWGDGTNLNDEGCMYEILEVPGLNPANRPVYTEPYDGKLCTFTNVQQNGDQYTLYIDANGILRLSTASAETLGADAVFKCTKQANGKYAFFNEAHQGYLVWRGGDAQVQGYNNNTGVAGGYNPAFCDWTIVSANGVQANTSYLFSKRNNAVADGSLIVMSATGEFNAWGSSLAWSSQYSNLFYIRTADAPTGIHAVQADDNARQRIYNLAGQRLSVPQKGVNIIDGKKVVR